MLDFFLQDIQSFCEQNFRRDDTNALNRENVVVARFAEVDLFFELVTSDAFSAHRASFDVRNDGRFFSLEVLDVENSHWAKFFELFGLKFYFLGFWEKFTSSPTMGSLKSMSGIRR